MHNEPHPQRGQIIPLLVGDKVYDFEVEDWWDRVSPRDDAERESMVYGKVDGLGRLVYDADLKPLTEDEIIRRWDTSK